MISLTVNDLNSNSDAILELLRKGGLIIYPTETVAGIGCVGYIESAIEKLFLLKKRELTKPVSYAFSSIKQMEKYVHIPNSAKPYLRYLPGPLTLILPLKKNAPKLFGLADNTIGVRIPDVPWLLKIIDKLNVPLVSTSANISSKSPVKTFEKLDKTIIEGVDILISWSGELTGVSSTVISFIGEKKILRKGLLFDDKLL